MDAFRPDPEVSSPRAFASEGRVRTVETGNALPQRLRHPSRRIGPALLALATLIGAAGCSSGAKPQALPPQTLAPDAPETGDPVSNSPQDLGVEEISNNPDSRTSQAPTVEPLAGAAASGSENDDSITMVIESPTGEGEAQQPSLFAAARAERERREQAERSTIVLDNETLKKYSKGSVTEMEPSAAPTGVSVDGAAGAEAAVPTAEGELEDSTGVAAETLDDEEAAAEDEATRLWRQEQYWRNRVLDIRQAWRLSLDRVLELEEEVAGLRRAFYAEDDPFYRDSQIKPAWDRALDELEDEKHAAERHERDLISAMDEGRREGALPGWLREGIELEPTEEEVSDTLGRDGRYHEASEPEIVDDGSR